jgi:hypothetical protein
MSIQLPPSKELEELARLRMLISLAKARSDARDPDTAQAIRDAEEDLRRYAQELVDGEADDE